MEIVKVTKTNLVTSNKGPVILVGKHNAVEEENTPPCLPYSGTARTGGSDEDVERGTDSLGENF
jgi:hypothetical protein